MNYSRAQWQSRKWAHRVKQQRPTASRDQINNGLDRVLNPQSRLAMGDGDISDTGVGFQAFSDLEHLLFLANNFAGLDDPLAISVVGEDKHPAIVRYHGP